MVKKHLYKSFCYRTHLAVIINIGYNTDFMSALTLATHKYLIQMVLCQSRQIMRRFRQVWPLAKSVNWHRLYQSSFIYNGSIDWGLKRLVRKCQEFLCSSQYCILLVSTVQWKIYVFIIYSLICNKICNSLMFCLAFQY